MKSFWSMVRNIESDRVSGSSEIAVKTINLAIHGLNMEIDRKEVFKALKGIKERFNEMATVKNVVSVLISKLAAADLRNPENVQGELVKLRGRVINAKKRIAEEFTGFLRGKTTILTLSRSSTVLECLREAGGRGLIKRVLVAESKPLSEGLKTAKQIKSMGLKVNLIPDLSLGFFTDKVDLGLTGADTVLPDGSIINKVGTYLLALALKDKEKPFYVATDTFKIDLSLRKPKLVEKRYKYMFEGEKMNGIEVSYDITPSNLITGIICEGGIIKQPLKSSIWKIAASIR